MSRWQASTAKKARAYKPFENAVTADEIKTVLKKCKLPQIIKKAVEEHLI